MTTTAQVRKLVQPILARNIDLALVGRWIFVKPVHHFARAILIDRSSNVDELVPQWAVMHLFEARTSLFLDWGEFLANERSRRRGLWFITQPDIDLALSEAIETQALPRLRAMATLDDFLAYLSRIPMGAKMFDWPTRRIILDAALGELQAAKAIGDAHLARWSVDHPYYDDDSRAQYRRLRELCSCLATDDRSGIAKLLHDWEAFTVRALKIEHIWEPTPFPLER
ncbi:MAG TPA: hypothetical protein VFW22_13370 [Pseudolabrys sp.]|nr:hypothetical protein [Pseudolabrys sp.]